MADNKVNDILIFMAVVNAGSFISAGKAFGLSRSAAGKAVARLENRYGVRLLNRTTRALSLTEAGHKLYQQGEVIRDAITAADTHMAATDGTPSGRLRIALPDALGRRLILPIIHRFQQKWPQMRFEVSFSDTISLMVKEGYDLAVRVGVTTPDTSLVARRLKMETLVLCASPAYMNAHDTPTHIEHLSTHDVLKFSHMGDRQIWALEESTEFWSNAPGRLRLQMDSAEALREAALQDMGIALLPEAIIKEDLRNGSLLRILPNVNCGEVPILVLYPHKKFLEPRVRHFIDSLVTNLSVER